MNSNNNNNLESLNTENKIAKRLLQNASSLTNNTEEEEEGKGFSGLEEKEPQEEDLVKYRAYSIRGRKDNRRDTYDKVDLWELHVRRIGLHKENFDWQRRNPNISPLVLKGGERRATLVLNPRYYQESGADYVALPVKLIKRRFTNVAEEELSEFIEDSKREDSGIDVMLEQPISGIASIREILEATAEEHLLHPAVASTADPEFEGKDEYERHNYQIEFEPISCWNYMDCSLHVDKVNEFLEPQFFLLGESIHSQEFKEARAKHRERKARVKKLRRMKTYLEAMMVVTNEILDMDSESNRERIRAEALKELEKEEQQKKKQQ